MNNFHTEFNFTNHGLSRSKNRSITKNDIDTIIKYGSVIYRQNIRFHFLKSSDIPGGLTLNKRISSIVVLTSWEGDIITSYYNERPQKHIEKKSKRYSDVKKRKRFKSAMSSEDTTLYQYGHINLA